MVLPVTVVVFLDKFVLREVTINNYIYFCLVEMYYDQVVS